MKRIIRMDSLMHLLIHPSFPAWTTTIALAFSVVFVVTLILGVTANTQGWDRRLEITFGTTAIVSLAITLAFLITGIAIYFSGESALQTEVRQQVQHVYGIHLTQDQVVNLVDGERITLNDGSSVYLHRSGNRAELLVPGEPHPYS